MMSREDFEGIEEEIELLVDELLRLRDERLIDEDDIDIIRVLVAGIVMKKFDVDKNALISKIFEGDRPIIWH